jgi:hypothetical protein
MTFLHGLYFGQIDVDSRLPDGLGVFHYCSSDDVKCYVRGEWKMGELTRRQSFRDCDRSSDGSNKSMDSEKLVRISPRAAGEVCVRC